MSSPSKRRDMDIMKLMMSDYSVSMGDNKDFYVKFYGPKDSPYEKGIWKVHVTLPVAYPYKSPSIGFCNKIYHPNVDEASGTVCLDVINQTWSPMFDLLNIFDAFLPQLLLYPNPADPLNGEAAALLLSNPKAYRERVQAHVQKHASQDIRVTNDDDDDEENFDDDNLDKIKENSVTKDEKVNSGNAKSSASSSALPINKSKSNIMKDDDDDEPAGNLDLNDENFSDMDDDCEKEEEIDMDKDDISV